MSRHGFSLLFLMLPGWLAVLTPLARAASESDIVFTLPAIVTEGTPADALGQDPILPSTQGETTLNSGGGSIQRGLGDQIALPVADPGKVGAAASFRGLGRSSEDNDVQALGVPLNSPQGGGFDLSSFPQYLWAGYQFQLGPSLNSFNPSGVSGSLVLVPWTQRALEQKAGGADSKESPFRLTQLFSGQGLSQTSIAGRAGNELALIAGFSDGDSTGPSGAISGRWGAGKVSGKYHLLATHLDAKASFSGSPRAHQLTTRMIPVIQADVDLGSARYFKTSVFFDGTNLRYDDPANPSFQTRDQIRQFGMENALFWRAWHFGLNARQVTYRQLSFVAPDQTVFNFHVARSLEAGAWQIEPSVQAVGVSGSGVHPQGSIGVRQDFPGTEYGSAAVFSRLTFSRRFASLTDRYYVLPGFFQGNPGLKPERVWTLNPGVELNAKRWMLSLQGYGQVREDSQMLSGLPGTPVNSGQARVLALLQTTHIQVTDEVDFLNGATLGSSHVEATGLAFPYLSTLTDVVTLRVHESGDRPLWLAEGSLRMGSRRQGMTRVLPGYGVIDLGAQTRVLGWARPQPGFQSMDLGLRLENALDRPVEWVEGYPIPGRVWSINLIGQF